MVELLIVIRCDYCQEIGAPAEFVSGSSVYEVAADQARRLGWLDDGPRDWWCPTCAMPPADMPSLTAPGAGE